MKANYAAAYAANPYLLHPQIMAMNAFASAANPHPPNLVEVQTLLKHPNVAARMWEPKKWYGGGIMHLKLWHADGVAAYLGSANADWKRLAQVNEQQWQTRH